MPEPKLIKWFWDMWDDGVYDNKFVGHNIHGFDLPFMVKRSWYLGIKIPYLAYDDRGYFHKSFVDLMKIWSLGDRSYIKLDRLGELLGVGRKTDGVTGADFARLWNGTKEERKKAYEYLENDLTVTAAIAKRMGVE
jgi:DNA polymerase III epsilon subunit-like protein